MHSNIIMVESLRKDGAQKQIDAIEEKELAKINASFLQEDAAKDAQRVAEKAKKACIIVWWCRRS